MTAITCKQFIARPFDAITDKFSIDADKASEWFWFTVCLLMFAVLGPFSAPVVLVVLFQLGCNASDSPEPQSVD